MEFYLFGATVLTGAELKRSGVTVECEVSDGLSEILGVLYVRFGA